MERWNLKMTRNENTKDKLGRSKVEIKLTRPANSRASYTKDQVFDILYDFSKRKCVMGAGTAGSDEGTSNAKEGLVQGRSI